MSYPPREPTEPPVDPYAGQTDRMPPYGPPGQQWPPTQQMPAGGYQQPQQPRQWQPTRAMPGQQSRPQWPPTPGPARQGAALQHAIALSSARGWRLEGASPGVATMVSGHKPNHVLHLLLTLFTCGLWAIAWIIIAATVTEKRLTIVADLDGTIAYPRGAYLPPQTAPGPYPQGAYPPPQQPKPLAVTTGGWLAIGGGVLAVVVLLAIAAGGGFSSSTQLADQSRNNNRLYDSPTPSDTGTTPATPAAPTNAPPPTTAAPKPPPPSAAVMAWWEAGGKTHMNNLGSDATDLAAAAKTVDSPGVRKACSSLQRHVEAAQAYAPFPDSEGQRWWAAALASDARSATDCMAGVDTTNADLMSRASSEMRESSADMEKLTERIKTLAG